VTPETSFDDLTLNSIFPALLTNSHSLVLREDSLRRACPRAGFMAMECVPPKSSQMAPQHLYAAVRSVMPHTSSVGSNILRSRRQCGGQLRTVNTGDDACETTLCTVANGK
jgi:hypothetical protein